MSHNLIQSLQSIEGCSHLQFVNLSHNLITDISPLLRLGLLSEIYLSHNLLSSCFISKSGTWPHLRILDLTDNKLNDAEDFAPFHNEHSMVALAGNPFCISGTKRRNWPDNLDFALCSETVRDSFSKYLHPRLFSLCFGFQQKQPVATSTGVVFHTFLNSSAACRQSQSRNNKQSVSAKSRPRTS